MKIYFCKLSFTLSLLCLYSAGFAQVPSWSWVGSSLPTSGSKNVAAVHTDAAGNIYSVGNTPGTLNLDNAYILQEGMFIVKYNPQGGIIWAKNLGKAYPVDFVTDAAGNSYITGVFTSMDTLVMGNFTFFCRGQLDMFTAKIDNTGNVVWARQAGGSNMVWPPMPGTPEDEGRSIGIDVAGNCYVSGLVTTRVNSPVTFDTLTLHHQGPVGIDMLVNFLAKYNANGGIQWVKTEGWGGNGAIRDLSVTPQGDIYSIRMIRDSFTVGGTTLVSNGLSDVCYTRYDSEGNLIWAKSFGGSGDDYGDAIAVNTMGELFLSGGFNDSLQLGSTTLVGNPDKARLYVAKCDSNGNVQWASQTTGTGAATDPLLAVDNIGNSYVACLISGSVLVQGQGAFVGSSFDPLVIKWDSAGVPVWGIAGNGGGADFVQGIALSPDYAACYIAGSYEYNLVFGSHTLNAGSSEAFYLAKIANAVSGLPAEATEAEWSVYPNPAQKQFYLNLPQTVQARQVRLTDMLGKEIIAVQHVNSETAIPLPDLPQGPYIISIETDKQVFRKKLIVQ